MSAPRTLPMLVVVTTALASPRAQTPELAPTREGRPTRPGLSAPLTPAWRAFYAGDLDKAVALARTSLKANPRDTGGRLVLARVAMERGDAESAYTELRRAQEHAPQDPDVLYHLALVAGHLARAAFDALYALAPDSPRVHQLLAESLEAQDTRAQAEAEYEAALRGDPKLVDALLGLAKLKRIRLACTDAIELYQRAEAVRPTFDGAFGLGTCYAFEGQDEQAVVAFRKAVASDDGVALAWVGLGSAYARSGRLKEGIAALERALAIDPTISDAHYALGLAYRRTGDAKRSQAAFEKAQQLQSGEPQR